MSWLTDAINGGAVPAKADPAGTAQPQMQAPIAPGAPGTPGFAASAAAGAGAGSASGSSWMGDAAKALGTAKDVYEHPAMSIIRSMAGSDQDPQSWASQNPGTMQILQTIFS